MPTVNWKYSCTYTWTDARGVERFCPIAVAPDPNSTNFNHIYSYGLCAKHYRKVSNIYNDPKSDVCLGYNFPGLAPKKCTVRDMPGDDPLQNFIYNFGWVKGRCQNCQSEKINAGIRSSWNKARILGSGRQEPIAFQNLQTCIVCQDNFDPEPINGPCVKTGGHRRTNGCQAYICRSCLFGEAPRQGIRLPNHANHKPDNWCPLCAHNAV